MTTAPRKSQKTTFHEPRNQGSCPRCMSETRSKQDGEYEFPGNGWACKNPTCYYGRALPPIPAYDPYDY